MQEIAPMTNEDHSTELVWVKPKWSRLQFELRAGDAVVATLDWARGAQALGRWGEATYRFSRKGWLRPRVLVRSVPAQDADAPLATFEVRRGTLILPDARAFCWQKPRRLARERLWVDDTGRELARFRPEKRATVVVIAPAEVARHPELPLLILLGQYLLVSAAQDAEAASTAAVIAAVGGGS